jgi:SOS response regulatory protein OraA/RecX
MSGILKYALRLLASRDHTISGIARKLEFKFGHVPGDVMQYLIRENYLNDRRFAENYMARRKQKGRTAVRNELIARGVAADIADEVLAKTEWPSLRQALDARMSDWKLRPPLQPGDAARLFRSLLRLGYEEDALREEIEQLHEQH